MPSEKDFIGSLVSIDCGLLGTYQGRLDRIDQSMNTLTISHAFHNGLSCDLPEISLSSTAILDIKILHTSQEAQEILTRKATSSKMTREIDEVTRPTCSSPVKIIKATSKTQPVTQDNLAASRAQPVTQEALTTSRTQPVTHDNLAASRAQPVTQEALTTSTTPTATQDPRITPKIQKSEKTETDHVVLTHNKKAHQKKRTSRKSQFKDLDSIPSSAVILKPQASHIFNGRIPLLGIDTESNNQPSSDQQIACPELNHKITPASKVSSRDMNVVKSRSKEGSLTRTIVPSKGFHCESNLALFNNHAAVYEVENGVSGLGLGTPDSQNLRCNDKVLTSQRSSSNSILLQQKRMLHFYFTDNGMAVPSVGVEVREAVCRRAAQYGLSEVRLLEAYGRGASEMTIQLIGGSHRIHPKNGHQQPSVVILCGLHETGALGACCARQLSSHGVQVTVLVERSGHLPAVLASEVELFKLTGGKLIHDVGDLPSPVDLLVTALDSTVNPVYSSLPWSQHAVTAVGMMDIKAQVLALDPPATGPGITARWSLCKVLPLPGMSASCGSLYLCDLAIPSAIFTQCGLTYSSPFGSKFVIPLYEQQ